MKKIFLAGFLTAALSITVCGNIKEVQAAEESADSVSTFDVNPDGSLTYEDLRHRWTTGTTWKASNGVEIKINDAFADSIKAGDSGTPAAIWNEDPDADPTPNSPYSMALIEFVYSDEAYLNGYDRWNPEVVKVSTLPDIPLATSKQTSVIETDESRAYKKAYDIMYGFQATGKWEANIAASLQFGYDGGVGIGLVSFVGGAGYLWQLEYDGSEWVLTIRINPSELQWDGLHNSLRLVSPDGETLFHAIYEDMYYGMIIPEYDTWYNVSALYNVPADSEICVVNTEGKGYARYLFR